MVKRCAVVLLLLIVLVPRLEGAEPGVDIRAGLGILEGEAREVFYAYLPERYKVSELTWDLSQVWLGGVVLDAALSRKMSLELGYWLPVSEGNGDLEDVDWLIYGAGWSDWSRGPVDVVGGSVLDIFLSFDLLQRDSLNLRGLVGLRRTEWEWEDWGGTFIYSSAGGFRDVSGTFPPGVGIRYRQEIEMPYVGLGLRQDGETVTWRAKLAYSPAVTATSVDEHVLRSLRVDADFSNGAAWLLGVSAQWGVAADLVMLVGADYEMVSEFKGEGHVRDGTGAQYMIPDGAGLSYEALSVSAALVWTPRRMPGG